MTSSAGSAIGEFIAAARLWRIWCRLGWQDLRLRFRRSAFGMGWIIVHFAVPLLVVGAIYGTLFDQDPRTFLPFLAAGLAVWSFLISVVVEGGRAFVVSEGYIKQIGLPVQVYVLRSFISTSITAAISLLTYVIVAAGCAVPVGWGTSWALVGLAVLAATAFLLIVILAHLTVRFRDTSHITSAGMQILFYVTPVVWPPEMLRGRRLAWVLDANPLYHLLEIVRQPLLSERPAALASYVVAGAVVLTLTVVALTVARCYSRRIVYLL